ncbi:MAG: Ig-like domain-containing protein [Myxococcota bacterium]|nr:Ig-like domain-containing protein [Myxococcota bacterium]
MTHRPITNRALLIPLACLFASGVTACDETQAIVPTDGGVLEDSALFDRNLEPVCSLTSQGLYDPFESAQLNQFPDDLLTERDEESPTGRRLSSDIALFPWASTAPPLLGNNFLQWDALSGFALSGKIFVSFSEPLAEDWQMRPPASDAVMLVSLTDEKIDRTSLELTWGFDGRTLFAQPRTPLRPGTTYAFLVTKTVTDAAPECLQAAPRIKELLRGDVGDPRFERVSPDYIRALDIADLEARDIAGATVFTTHRDHEVLFDAADNIRRRRFQWNSGSRCEEKAQWIECRHSFNARDYRNGAAVFDPRPVDTYRLPVRSWYPTGFDTPRPIMIYGHGLNSNFGEVQKIVDEYIGLGYAIIATPALQHVDHPTRLNPDSTAALDFLGIDIPNLQIDAFKMRGHFSQTTLDRLQLLQLLRDVGSLPGFVNQNLDTNLSIYFGVSLGGLLGSSLLALDDQLRAGILSVAGGQLIAFATDTASVEVFRPVLVNIFDGEAIYEKMLTVAQTFVDAADPATFAPHVFYQRNNPESRTPDILMPVAVYDDIVPPSTGRALARALRIPHVGPQFTEVFGIERQGCPAQGNGRNGESTQGYFQFDRVERDGRPVPAQHTNTPESSIALEQLRVFLQSILDGQPGLIVDPYQDVDLPELPQEP